MTHTPQPRILLVDDNAAIHDDFRKVLARASEAQSERHSSSEAALFGESASMPAPQESVAECEYELDDALQGEEAVEKAREAFESRRPFAMAFLDVRMPPGIDGIETARRLWEVDPDLQIVLCTAYSDYTWHETVAALGRTDRLLILKKPFDTVEACQLAAALTEKRASLQRERENLAAARRAELEARAYAASLETMNRALQSSWAQSERELTRRNAYLQRLASEVLAPAQGLLLERLDVEVAGDVERGANLGLERLLDPAIAVVSAIDCVLELSAIDAGQARVERAPCAVGELSERVASTASRCSNTRVQAHIGADVPATILSDAARIERILDELVANAVRHCEDGRVEIAVALDAQPGMLSVTVQDDGVGLSREAQAHVFEPFHARSGERAGLGLTLARRTATLLGGELVYEPRDERGARFRLRLPTRTGV
ncbi:MAG: response regulator [Planctomycetes bacterium]|nr:response regulator [Planctomycetota bacterium]